MVVEHATMEDAIPNGIDLGSNAFMLVHGWTAGHILIEFVARALGPLKAKGMTAADLAREIGVHEGPLTIVLRTCSVLDYVTYDPATSVYAAVPGQELDELEAHLGPSAPATASLRSIYTDAVPPFQVASDAALRCIETWARLRPSWRSSKSRSLPILMDGIVLAPLLTSIAYFARWDEAGLDLGKDRATQELSFGELEATARGTLAGILAEVGVGKMGADGSLRLSPKGALAFQRCYAFFVPTSYSPLLAKLPEILTEEPGWGFADAVDGDPEEHVRRTLNVVGSGAQHKTFFKDMMCHVHHLFDGDDFESQPRFVVDVGSGDGHLLMHVYEHVKSHTRRGQVLDDYPLTMVGVDFNEEARVATALNLSNHGIPHRVISGDIGKPSAIVAALRRKKVDPAKTLHVRSFLDHDRPYIAPVRIPDEASAQALYARTQMADCVHLDRQGKPISPVEVFASLLEHFERWGDAVESSFGLCVLEVMMLDVATTRRFLNDSVSFHFDVVQCLSRQYMVSPAAFAMGAATAGLFPADFDAVQAYPEQAKYCRVLGQRLVRRPYRIRFAERSDLDELLRLEQLAWAENLRAKPEVIQRRLETSPTTNLVAEMGGRVVAVLYMQLLSSLDAIDAQKFMEASDQHAPGGRIVQLIAISADPEAAGVGVGSTLRSFALHLARVDPAVDCVVGVTRCSDFDGKGTLEEYVRSHADGAVSDKTLSFHTSHRAEVVRLVPGFRPEDTANSGTGVLIRYRVKEWPAKRIALSPGARAPAKRGPSSEAPMLEIVKGIMEELSYAVDDGDLARGFLDYGADSLELVRIRNMLGHVLGFELQSTLLLDFPNVQDLAQEVDRLRKRRAAETKEARPSFDSISAPALVQLLEKCSKKFGLPQYQTRFCDLAAKSEDPAKYLGAIEATLNEVMGPVLVAEELIDDLSTGAVQAGRASMTACVRRLTNANPSVQAAGAKLLRLTGQDGSFRPLPRVEN